MDISKSELRSIINSYGIKNLTFDAVKHVGPDMAIYFFHDANRGAFALLAADYLGGYEELAMPYVFAFDDDSYDNVSFRATKVFPYRENAPKKADDYIDDKHLWTQADTGDVCMLFACADVQYSAK